MFFFGLLILPASASLSFAQTNIDQQRQTFLKAIQAADKGQIESASQMARQIPDYVLTPYIDYRILMKKLYGLPTAEVEDFLKKNGEYWVGERLRQNWLNVLKQKKQYATFLQFTEDSHLNTEQLCFYYDALAHTGEKSKAWEGAKQLWLSAKSQPDECDPLFAAWRKSPAYDPQYTWQRYLLASTSGQNSLANYLHNSILEMPYKEYAGTVARIQSQPSLLKDDSLLRSIPASEGIVVQGLEKLAKANPQTAQQLWDYYRSIGLIDEPSNAKIYSTIANALSRDEDPMIALNLARQYAEIVSESEISRQIRKLLPTQNWPLIQQWLQLLSTEEANSSRWKYWQARTHQQLGEPYLDQLETLSEERSFYGFLASLYLNKPFNFQDKDATPKPETLVDIRNHLGIRQSLELKHVGMASEARQAWFHETRNFDLDQWFAAATISQEENWHFVTINSMIRAGFWDDMEFRFPLAYFPEIEKFSTKAGINPTWAIAISRQESSFLEDVKSPAGAIGIMQLMPATAKETAKSQGIAYSQNRLIEPAYNIQLGTAFLRKAYDSLEHNPVYATAAYNAGISRAKSWLSDGKDRLPLDIWVETIPFLETRNYVQNVMAFSAIYAAKLNTTHPMEQLGSRFFESK